MSFLNFMTFQVFRDPYEPYLKRSFQKLSELTVFISRDDYFFTHCSLSHSRETKNLDFVLGINP